MFRIGQKIVCINGKPDQPKDAFWVRYWPIEGTTYTVRGVDHSGGKGPGVLLEEISNYAIPIKKRTGEIYYAEPIFLEKRFRPATDITIFENMLRHERVCEPQ